MKEHEPFELYDLSSDLNDVTSVIENFFEKIQELEDIVVDWDSLIVLVARVCELVCMANKLRDEVKRQVIELKEA